MEKLDLLLEGVEPFTYAPLALFLIVSSCVLASLSLPLLVFYILEYTPSFLKKYRMKHYILFLMSVGAVGVTGGSIIWNDDRQATHSAIQTIEENVLHAGSQYTFETFEDMKNRGGYADLHWIYVIQEKLMDDYHIRLSKSERERLNELPQKKIAFEEEVEQKKKELREEDASLEQTDSEPSLLAPSLEMDEERLKLIEASQRPEKVKEIFE